MSLCGEKGQYTYIHTDKLIIITITQLILTYLCANTMSEQQQ
jgi:hypothetical protein